MSICGQFGGGHFVTRANAWFSSLPAKAEEEVGSTARHQRDIVAEPEPLELDGSLEIGAHV